MEDIVLKAERRTVIGKQVNALRRAGKLPAILYGHHFEPLAITLDSREATRILAGITSSHLITIDVQGSPHAALVREKQRHPVRGNLIHVDFLAVSMTEKLRTMVVISVNGEAPAVKEKNGLLVTGVEELEVECLPGDLPERIDVDISKLENIGDAIYVRDLPLPSVVEVLTDPNEMVILVTAPIAEEVEEVAVEAGGAEPEVIEKGKKEEEEED
jgi:large subunit ribosomal protein L25